MEDDPTPIEGKGDEMIPNRGIPFKEVDEEEFLESSVQDFSESGSMDETSEAIPEDIAEILSESEESLEAVSFEDETAASEDETETIMGDVEPPGDSLETADSLVMEEAADVPSQLLDIEEIRARELEIAEDSHTPPPDFDGDLDGDFTATRVPVPLPRGDREAIMFESGAGILDEDALDIEEEVEEVPFGLDSGETDAFAARDEEIEPFSEPVAETPSPPIDVVRERLVFTKESFEMPGPIGESVEVKAPEAIAGLKATKKMLDLLIPNKRVEQLWNRADELQTQVFNQVNDLNLARALLEQIRSAKTLMLADKENFEEAERSINEVEYRVIYGQRFQQWGQLGYALLLYEVLWGVAAVVAMYLLIRAGVEGINLNVEGLLSGNEIFIGTLAALFGALGGVAGALFALWRYITEQKFNPQFSIWYVSQPIIGLVIGSVIYIILKIGFNITAGTVSAEVGSPLLPCLLAYLAGFQQNVFLDLARQILKQFKFGSSDSGNKAEDENLPGTTNAAG